MIEKCRQLPIRQTQVFTYDYSLSNSGTEGIFLFTLDVSGPVLTTAAPTGWLVSTTPLLGDVLVSWGSNDASFDVLHGGSVSGFVLTSDLPPGSVQFTALDESLKEFTGSTRGPLARSPSVPEPPSFVLIGSALMGLALFSSFGKLSLTCSRG